MQTYQARYIASYALVRSSCPVDSSTTVANFAKRCTTFPFRQFDPIYLNTPGCAWNFQTHCMLVYVYTARP